MSFFRIEMLFFIWIVPLLVLIIVYGMRRRQGILSRFASDRGLAAIVPDSGRRRRWIKGGLLAAAVFFGALPWPDQNTASAGRKSASAAWTLSSPWTAHAP
jgi:Ca-activated chloride channel family protein